MLNPGTRGDHRHGSRALIVALVAWSVTAGCGIAATRLPITPSGVTSPSALQTATVDADTMSGKLLFGYQGWFGCPGDGSPLRDWHHWFRGGEPASAASVRVDMWPDVSELAPDERCPTPLTLPDGRVAEVFSAYDRRTVDRHFRWLQQYELPGVVLQRFSHDLDNLAVQEFRDGVARNVRTAAEFYGRVFALTYDISGHPRESVVQSLKDDWVHLVDELRVTQSPRYLRHRGRPVLTIWGFGFRDRSVTPEQAAELVDFFKNNPVARYRVTLVGGIPSRWRSLTRDSQDDARWASVYRSFDVLSPWTVGRFANDRETDRFYKEEVERDLRETRRLRIDYMPVLFPGFSWHNMNPDSPFNRIPRRGGRFYWRQVERALSTGATMLFGAMFDEVDEGTAMFKVAPTLRDAPKDPPFVTLDVDGEVLPNDWYLRLARETQRRLTQAMIRPRAPKQDDDD